MAVLSKKSQHEVESFEFRIILQLSSFSLFVILSSFLL